MIINELSQDIDSTIPTHLSEELKVVIDEFIRKCFSSEYLDPFSTKNTETHSTRPTAEDLKRVLLDKNNREDFLKTLSKFTAQLILSERIKDDSFIEQLFAKNNSKFLKERFKLTDEDLALHLNGEKKKIKRRDFEIAMNLAGIHPKVIENIFKKYKRLLPKWSQFIDDSFLPQPMKIEYKNLIHQKSIQIDL